MRRSETKPEKNLKSLIFIIWIFGFGSMLGWSKADPLPFGNLNMFPWLPEEMSSGAELTQNFPLVGETILVFSDDFETNKGWVVNPYGDDTAIPAHVGDTGMWERAIPQTTLYNTYNYQILNHTLNGSFDLVTGASAGSGAGDFDIDGGRTSILSPEIQLPASDNITLSFYYYFAHLEDATTDDYFRVRVLGNGAELVIINKQGSAVNKPAAWILCSGSLSQFSGQKIRIYIEAADLGANNLTEAAVDDLKIESVPNLPPSADFMSTVTNFLVKFTDQSTCNNCTLTNWSWSFGDSSTSTLQDPSHQYKHPGTYTVNLIVTDSQSLTASKTSSLVLQPVREDILASFASNLGVDYRDSVTAEWIELNPNSARQVVAADINGDGLDDLLGWWDIGIWIRYSESRGWEQVPVDVTLLTWLSACDLNGDGRDDIIGSWASGVWWRNSATGIWENRIPLPAYQVTAGDVNGDSQDELIGWWDIGIWIFYPGTGVWQKIEELPTVQNLTNIATVNMGGFSPPHWALP